MARSVICRFLGKNIALTEMLSRCEIKNQHHAQKGEVNVQKVLLPAIENQ
jgi:hypothetical protein